MILRSCAPASLLGGAFPPHLHGRDPRDHDEIFCLRREWYTSHEGSCGVRHRGHAQSVEIVRIKERASWRSEGLDQEDPLSSTPVVNDHILVGILRYVLCHSYKCHRSSCGHDDHEAATAAVGEIFVSYLRSLTCTSCQLANLVAPSIHLLRAASGKDIVQK